MAKYRFTRDNYGNGVALNPSTSQGNPQWIYLTKKFSKGDIVDGEVATQNSVFAEAGKSLLVPMMSGVTTTNGIPYYGKAILAISLVNGTLEPIKITKKTDEKKSGFRDSVCPNGACTCLGSCGSAGGSTCQCCVGNPTNKPCGAVSNIRGGTPNNCIVNCMINCENNKDENCEQLCEAACSSNNTMRKSNVAGITTNDGSYINYRRGHGEVLNFVDISNADKLTENFSGFITTYMVSRPPYQSNINDYVFQQAGLPNGERLSDDYPYGFNGEEKSNFQIFGIGKPSPKQLAKKEKKDVNQQITGCVKPKALATGIGGLLLGGGIQQIALLNKYKKDMAAYNKCLQDAKAKIQSQASVSSEAQNTIDDLNKKLEEAKADANNISKIETNTTNDTILGIPKVGFWIGVGVLTLIGGIVTYKIIKNRKK